MSTTSATPAVPSLRMLWSHLNTAVDEVVWADRHAAVRNQHIAVGLWAAAAAHITAVEDALDSHDFGDDTDLIEFELDCARSVLLRYLAKDARQN